jgi:hypothetical protein
MLQLACQFFSVCDVYGKLRWDGIDAKRNPCCRQAHPAPSALSLTDGDLRECRHAVISLTGVPLLALGCGFAGDLVAHKLDGRVRCV